MFAMLALVLILLGIFLVVHDILYHLGLWVLEIGRPFYLFGKIRIYHAYVGLILVLIGLFLITKKNRDGIFEF